jgi:hypothetical protein
MFILHVLFKVDIANKSHRVRCIYYGISFKWKLWNIINIILVILTLLVRDFTFEPIISHKRLNYVCQSIAGEIMFYGRCLHPMQLYMQHASPNASPMMALLLLFHLVW